MSSIETAVDQPIQDFSQCHAGIIRKLDMLAELPVLLAPATRAREIAERALEFFKEAIFEHHLDEERELFPAVLGASTKGEEQERVQKMIMQLTLEHRELEDLWKRLESGLKDLVKGRKIQLNPVEIESLVNKYRAHAHFEENEFLPISQTVLGRNSNHMAALGMSLHMRHSSTSITNFI